MSINNHIHDKKRYTAALKDLLYQLADDDFILSFRGSEWLGLAPHIEEDVAFSSINQDTMGHAAMYYQLLEELGEGKMDDLAHARPSMERRNAVLLEKVNGPGHYLVEPEYDWAFTVVRNYFYVQAKKIRIESLKTSSYKPLSDLAIKINMELYYHLLHWKTWFSQLILAGGDARARMEEAIKITVEDFGGVLALGSTGSEMAQYELIESEEILKNRWVNRLKPVFENTNLSSAYLQELGMKNGNGRNGEHTSDLEDAITTFCEVYNINPAASW